jgi:hypothetical protein
VSWKVVTQNSHYAVDVKDSIASDYVKHKIQENSILKSISKCVMEAEQRITTAKFKGTEPSPSDLRIIRDHSKLELERKAAAERKYNQRMARRRLTKRAKSAR